MKRQDRRSKTTGRSSSIFNLRSSVLPFLPSSFFGLRSSILPALLPFCVSGPVAACTGGQVAGPCGARARGATSCLPASNASVDPPVAAELPARHVLYEGCPLGALLSSCAHPSFLPQRAPYPGELSAHGDTAAACPSSRAGARLGERSLLEGNFFWMASYGLTAGVFEVLHAARPVWDMPTGTLAPLSVYRALTVSRPVAAGAVTRA